MAHFKYYKFHKTYYQVSEGKCTFVHLDANRPLIEVASEDLPKFEFESEPYEPTTMEYFETAYLIVRYYLDKQALQSRKMKEVQS